MHARDNNRKDFNNRLKQASDLKQHTITHTGDKQWK